MKQKLIQDVIPPGQQSFDTIPKAVMDAAEAAQLPTEVMVEELFNRRVDIKRIFAQYYALEEMATHRFDSLLTVEDVELVGYGTLPDQPLERQPF